MTKPADADRVRSPLADPDLRALLDRPLLPEARFLSVYLDARPDAQGKRHFDLFLDKRARTTRGRVRGVRGDLRGYDRVIGRIREFLQTADMDGVSGIAVFAEIPPAHEHAGGEAAFFQAFRLPIGVDNRFILGHGPDLGPVLRALGRFAHYLAVRLDADDARILSVYLARVVEAESERAEGIDQEIPGRIRATPGGWSQMRFQRRREELAQRWYRDLVGEIDQMVRREAPDGVVLLGQDVNLAAFEQELPESLAARVLRTDTVEPHSTDAEILARVEPLLAERREAAHARAVDELHDRVLADWYAVGGIDDTLEALQQGRVERLIVARGLEASGKQCRRCGFLQAARHDRCLYCGGDLVEVPLLQHLIQKAESQDAAIDIVDDPDPKLTDDLEGLGALLRVWRSDEGEVADDARQGR